MLRISTSGPCKRPIATLALQPGHAPVVRQRVEHIKDLLLTLKATKQAQDFSAQPTKGRGVWLNSNVWGAVNRQLESQASEYRIYNCRLLLVPCLCLSRPPPSPHHMEQRCS